MDPIRAAIESMRVPFFTGASSTIFPMELLPDAPLKHKTYSASLPSGEWSLRDIEEDVAYVWHIPKDAHVHLSMRRTGSVKNRTVQVMLAEGACLQLDCIDDALMQQDVWLLQLADASRCIVNHCVVTSDKRATHTTVHAEKASSLYYHSAIYLKENADMSHCLKADVCAPDVFIQHQVNAVLLGASHGSLESLVHLYPESCGVKTKQHMKTFILSPEASIKMFPDLVIDHNQVEASHGACSGFIDPEWVAYARTRGLSEDLLRSLYSMDFLGGSLYQPGALMQEYMYDFAWTDDV